MTITAGVGMSRHRDPRVAGRAAAEQALSAAGVTTPDFVFLFTSVGYDQRLLLQAVRAATGGAPLSGCSGEGTITGDAADESNFSVVVMAIASDELHWRNGIAVGLQADSAAVGRSVAQAIQPALQPDTLGLFVFPDGLTVNFDAFLAGLTADLRHDRFLPLWGGAAGDNLAWKQTYQFCDDQIVSDGVAYAVLAGDAEVNWAYSHGCIPIGSERTVTRCQGNVIYEIDGKPVLDIITEYLADQAIVENWPQYVVTLALCFKAPGHMAEDEYIVRGMPSVDAATGAVTIQTEVVEGAQVWMSSRDHEQIMTGLTRIAERLTQQNDQRRPKLVFQFDCAGRGKLVFRDQDKLALLGTLRQRIGAGLPWIGFYTFGEIAPVGRQNAHHNYTAVLLTIS